MARRQTWKAVVRPGCGIIFLCVILLTSGCAPRVRVTRSPDGSDSLRHVDGTAIPARLGESQSIVNGQSGPTSEDFRKRVQTTLTQSGLFTFPSTPEASDTDIRLTTTERLNPNRGGNFARGFLIGMSFFTLSPIVPLATGYGIDLNVTATLPDGTTRQYTSSATGTASFTMFQDGVPVARQLATDVTTRALNGLSNAIAQDAAVLQAAARASSSLRAERASTTSGEPMGPTAAAAAGTSVEERLRSLARMRADGLISNADYEAQKKRLLNAL